MSYPQFGYPYSSAPQFLMTTNSLTTCCETSGRTLTDSGAAAAAAASAQTPVYCPVYESRLLASARHELNSAAALGVYGSPYAGSQGYSNYVAYGSEASAFYSLNSFESKEGNGSAHAGLAPAAYYPYDPALSQYQYDRYGSIDGGTRRKNATRETTSTLKAWLQEHRKNPYPTKGEKIMLAIITKMTLTQVSTWFANARRRLKKENKMTWPPRNKGADEKRPYADEEDDEGDAPPGDSLKGEKLLAAAGAPAKEEPELALSDLDDYEPLESESSEGELKTPAFVPVGSEQGCPGPALQRPKGCLPDAAAAGGGAKRGYEQQQQQQQQPPPPPLAGAKPRIWSLAQTAAALAPAELPSCMLKRQQDAPERPAKDSPVASLRDWVDGVFHEPLLFRHGSGSGGGGGVSWAGPKASSLLPSAPLGRGAALLKAGPTDSGKDLATFPKAGGRVFCS